MPKASEPISAGVFRRTLPAVMSLSTLYQYLYCMVVSGALLRTPVFGGALFMSARVAMELSRMAWGDGRKNLSRRMRIIGSVLLGAMLLCNILLLAVYPKLLNADRIWILFAVVLLLNVRSELSQRLAARRMRNAIGKSGFITLLLALQLIPAGIVCGLFFPFLSAVGAWQLLGGFALSSVLECYNLWRERGIFTEESATAAQDTGSVAREMRTVNAYHAFERLHMLILIALQLTLVMVYTFVGLTADEWLVGLALSVGLTMLFREGTDRLLKGFRHKHPTINSLLPAGLVLWVCGLVLFYRQLGQAADFAMSYVSLGLSISGVTVCVTCLADLERQMTAVARFGLENKLEGYPQMRVAVTEIAILFGQMAALVLLTVLCIPAGSFPADIGVLARNFRPLMILPPLLLLAAAGISVLHFPLNNRYFQKLGRFLTLKEAGGDNPALAKQLDSVVVKRHKNRFGIRIIIALLRPLYWHKVLGKENIAKHEDDVMILVCNHGELYGPIVSNLFVPVPFRPWIISSMMFRDTLVDYMYEGTMVRQRWLPESWKKPLVRVLSAPLTWAFESLEGIPVYRKSPHELVKTFRLTVEAMQAGDNILLFPENGENQGTDGKGYVSEGVGELYTGFVTLAPMYFSKTGKQAVFMPIYASKRLRTLTLGEGIAFRSGEPSRGEKLRVVKALQDSMQAMYRQELDIVAVENEKRRQILRGKKRLNAKEQAELRELEEAEKAAPSDEERKGGE